MKNYFFLLLIFLPLKTTLLSAQPGTLDPTFGKGGILLMDSSSRCGDMLVQPDGKILVLGAFAYFSGGDELLRLQPNGSLDRSFSGDGIVETNGSPGPNESQIMRALAIQPDGKIICCGWQSDNVHRGALILVRFHADGTRDNSFGTLGEVFVQESTTLEPQSVVVQPDGKIIALANHSARTYLYRYLPNGTTDVSFGTNGKFVIDIQNNASFKALVQPDNKILVVGQRQVLPALPINYNGLLVRLLPNGAYDNTFGTNGVVEQDFEGGFDSFRDAVLQPDGHIITVGSAKISGNTSVVVMRFLPNGTPNPNFGNSGIALIAQGSAAAAFIQPDGKILVSGSSNSDYFCARLDTNGSPDKSFGDDGMVLANVGTAFNTDNANALDVQPDGKILLAGDNTLDVVLARYHSGLSVGLPHTPSPFGTPLVFPNPVRGGTIALEYELPSASEVRVELLDWQGKKLAALLAAMRPSGENKETLELPTNLAEGVYWLRLRDKKGHITVKIETFR